jgi:hypothetical protein
MYAERVAKVCDVYQQAPTLHEQGVHVMSTDEKTGMQALERLHPTKPSRPGLIELQECEYKRRGTLCLTPNFEVATGRILNPRIAFTRTNLDFVAHINASVSQDPEGTWIFIGVHPILQRCARQAVPVDLHRPPTHRLAEAWASGPSNEQPPGRSTRSIFTAEEPEVRRGMGAAHQSGKWWTKRLIPPCFMRSTLKLSSRPRCRPDSPWTAARGRGRPRRRIRAVQVRGQCGHHRSPRGSDRIGR